MSYIGNQPVLNTSEFREEFAVTSTQTVFNTGGFTASSDSATLEVLRNGVLLGTADYTLGSDASTVTLANAAVNGDIIVIKGRRELTNGVQVTERRHEHTIASGETTVTFPYPLTVSQTDVYLNGVKLGSSDFSINSSTRVVRFTINPAVGDLVAIVSREPALTANSSLPVVDAAGNNVLSESSGTVTLTADEANVGSNALVVNSSGNVGIGTDSPNSLCEIRGSLDGQNVLHLSNSAGTSDGGAENQIRVTCNGNTNWGDLDIQAYTTIFTQNNVPRMRIDSSGNVGIGTSPLHKLHVKSADATSIFVVGNTTESTQLEVLTYQDSRVVLRSNDNGSGRALAFETGTTERMRIDSSGGITMLDVYSDTVTGRDLYISSSGKLGYVSSVRSSKTNIENLPSISWLYELTPVKFQYRIKDGDDNYIDEAEPEIQYGFIAEDVVEVNSDLVFGDETENGFELRGIQYSRLIAPMIKAIQEQQALIESQQSQIDALTARIEALEATP